MTFKALLARENGETISTDLIECEENDLMPDDVTITVDYSTVNYKDGVALIYSVGARVHRLSPGSHLRRILYSPIPNACSVALCLLGLSCFLFFSSPTTCAAKLMAESQMNVG